MANNYQVQSVARALDILESLAEHDGTGRLTDIAKDVGCSKNTAFRLLHTLKAKGYVRQAEDSSYELTFKLLNLGESVIRTIEVQDVARPYLQELARLCGETTALAVLDDYEIVYLARVLGSSPFNTTYSIGSRAKAYSTALGKAILAFSPPGKVEEIVRRGLHANTEFTITDPARLHEELRQVALKRHAVDNQENVLGIRCVAAPIFDRRGCVVAAISVASLDVRLTDERIQEIAPQLSRTADTISSHLGYTSG